MPAESSAAARLRVLATRERLEELQALRWRLASGEQLDSSDVVLAEQRRVQAEAYAESARRHVVAAYDRAAHAHRSAAKASALVGDQEAAERHRRAADADQAFADGLPDAAHEP